MPNKRVSTTEAKAEQVRICAYISEAGMNPARGCPFHYIRVGSAMIVVQRGI